MFRIATTATRTLTRVAQPAPRYLSASVPRAFPTQGGVAPTTTSSSAGTDRGGSLKSDIEEGQQKPTTEKKEQTTNTSATSAANSQAGSPKSTASADKEGVAAGGNPLKPGAAGRGFHTSAIQRSKGQEDGTSEQHPGKSDVDHLENPSLSEETVHADRLPASEDPLKNGKAASPSGGAANSAQASSGTIGSTLANATATVSSTIETVADKARDGAAAVADKIRGRKSFHTSAISRSKGQEDGTSEQHPGKSDLGHLENPSASEETVHADREAHDPLPDHKKSGEQKKKTNESAGVKDNVSELKKKGVDDLPDGESTLRSIGGGN